MSKEGARRRRRHGISGTAKYGHISRSLLCRVGLGADVAMGPDGGAVVSSIDDEGMHQLISSSLSEAQYISERHIWLAYKPVY